jgi:TfuA protein
MSDTVIYLGPTLSQTTAASILEAEYLPPICRGDLARLSDEVRFVGIVDGEFYQRLAVSPKELLPLLRRGVRVFGASSMGALRAAETYKFGTIGIGKIFAMFRDGVLDGDDEVALLYDPETYQKLSEPLVNLRSALDMATESKIIDEVERVRLVLQMKSCYFPDRSHKALQRLCPALATYFRDAILPDVKRDDALQLLVAIKHARTVRSSQKLSC